MLEKLDHQKPLPEQPIEWVHDANRRAELANEWRHEDPLKHQHPSDYYRYVTERTDTAKKWRDELEHKIDRGNQVEKAKADWISLVKATEERFRQDSPKQGDFHESASSQLKPVYDALNDLSIPVLGGIHRLYGDKATSVHDALKTEAMGLVKREGPVQAVKQARESIVQILADALPSKGLAPELRWKMSEDWFSSSSLSRSFRSLDFALQDWVSELGLDKAPDKGREADLAEEVKTRCEELLEARKEFLKQVSGPESEWNNAALPLSISGGGMEVVAVSRQIAEQLWARFGASSFTKMASRIGELNFDRPESELKDTKLLFEKNRQNLRKTWNERMEAVEDALKNLDSGDWKELYQFNRVSHMGDWLSNWCEEIAKSSPDLQSLDTEIRLIAHDVPFLKECAREIGKLGDEYSGIGDFFDETLDSMVLVMQGQIAFQVKRNN